MLLALLTITLTIFIVVYIVSKIKYESRRIDNLDKIIDMLEFDEEEGKLKNAKK